MDKEGHSPWIKRDTTQLCPSLSMGCVHLYPWVVSIFIHGLCPSLSMGCVSLYPWAVSRETQPMDKEGHSPWIKRDTTHG
jgi:hypothetical protein